MSTEQEPDFNSSTTTESSGGQDESPIKVTINYAKTIEDHEYFQPSTPTNEEAVENTSMSNEENAIFDDEDCELKTITENIIREERQNVVTPKPSRELKLLLALSKEANLDTNIVHKRKSAEPGAKTDSPGRSSTDSQDFKLKNQENELQENINTIIGVNSKEFEISTSDNADTTEIKDKDKDNSPNKYKKSIGGAVDENGRRNRKLSNSSISMNNKGKDPFCWQCHHQDTNIFCKSCPRSYHQKCLKQSITQPNHWMCPECATIMQAENLKQRSSAMQDMTLVHLCVLLKYALKRMLQIVGCEPFIHPVNDADFPDYKNYIVHPMDLTCLEKNIKKNVYGSPQAFEADAKWIVHNSIIFNSYQSKLTSVAKSLLKICKQEMNEIENCATCYLNANTKKKTWFIEVCPKPHILVWAKLKGFPYWPAKAMRTNQLGLVDVRFFGAHDRAWIHHKECFLFSMRDPNSNKQKKNDIIQSVKELQLHVENLKKVYGEFQYAPYRLQFEPDDQFKQLQIMLPNYPNKVKLRRSLSKTKTNGAISSNEQDKSKQKDKEVDGNESEGDEDMNETVAIQKTKLQSPSCSEVGNSIATNYSDNTNDSKNPFNRNTRVRMRGGITNSSGKLKVKLSTPELKKRKRSSSEMRYTQITNKFMRRNSDQSDTSLNSNNSDKINKLDITENMEITFGDKSENCEEISENDAIKSNSDTTAENKCNSIIQVGLNENSEISIPSQSKSKISDHLMRKLSEPNSTTDSTFESIDAPTNSKINETEIYVDKTNNLTILEKITELTPDDDIFDNIDVSDDSKDFVHNMENMTDFNNHSLCTEEIELDDKDGVLTSIEQNEHNSSIDDDINMINDSSEIIEENSEQLDLSISDDNERVENNKDNTVTSTSVEETVDHETNLNQKTCEEMASEEAPLLEKEDDVNIVTIDLSQNEQNIDKHSSPSNLTEKSPKSTHNENNEFIEKTCSVIESGFLKRNKVTIVNVEDIRKKNLDKHSPIKTSLDHQSILENQLIGSRESNQSDKDDFEIDSVIVVKSEPSSEDEPIDTEYLEKKRMYLSALNISEKMPKRLKPNEIRTRSKTEERKFKPVDNISKVIDDVASHYSINHANEEITIIRTPKKKEIFIKPLPSLQDIKPRARKTFPTVKHVYPSSKKELPLKVCKTIAYPITRVQSPLSTAIATISKSSEVSPTNNVTSTSTSSANNMSLLPSNQQVGYSAVTKPVITMVQNQSGSTVGGIFLQPAPVSIASVFTTNLESQNYIPQSGAPSKNITANTSKPSLFTSISNVMTTMSNIVPLPTVTTSVFNGDMTAQLNNIVEEVQSVTGSLPEPLSRSVNDILYRVPPKLKPRPPGPLSTQFDEGVPSSAGSVSSKINSISHRLGDYLRGMLVELLNEMGSSSNIEAEITKLKLENEELKQRHSGELLEIKKNISVILRDMQKSLNDEKTRIIEETRSICELETVKRVEEAKSKQWCANCSKEAQFYCCWNTSYCDYPCQQKHWPSHMSKCTQQMQNAQMQNSSPSTFKTATQPLVLRQTNPPKGFKAIIGKSQVLLNRPSIGKIPLNFTRTASGNHITLVESTPGNYEVLGNGGLSVGGSFITNMGKIQSGNVLTMTSATNSNTNVETVTVKKSIVTQISSASTSKTTTIITDGKNDGK